MSLPEAHREARRTLPTLLATGGGPKYPCRPMTEFAEEFLERHARHWKSATLATKR